MINLNDYLSALHEAKSSDKIGDMELGKTILNSIPNLWSKEACVQGSNLKKTTKKKSVNMFEHTKIVETIYEVVVEPYDKNY